MVKTGWLHQVLTQQARAEMCHAQVKIPIFLVRWGGGTEVNIMS